jgi:tetratricopeptide (TPR) repeat protein
MSASRDKPDNQAIIDSAFDNLRHRNFPKAIKKFDKILAISSDASSAKDPNFDLAKIGKAYALFNSYFYTTAELLYLDILAEDSNNILANALLGKAYLFLRKDSLANQYLQKAIEVYESKIQALPEGDALSQWEYFGAGEAYDDKKNHSKAQEIYEIAIKLNPNFAIAHCGLGIVLSKQQEFPDSAEAFNNALKIDPKFAKAYCNLGDLLRNESFTDAVKAYENAIKIDHKFFEAYYNLGLLYFDNAEYDKAIDMANNAIDCNHKDDAGHQLKGKSLYCLGKYEDAATVYKAAIALDYREITLKQEYTAVLYQLERDKEAIAVCDEVLVLNPRDEISINNKAWYLYKTGEFVKAQAICDQAIANNISQKQPFLDTTACIYRALGDYDNALEYFNQARGAASSQIEFDQYEPLYLCNIGIVQCLQRDYERAFESFSEAKQRLTSEQASKEVQIFYDKILGQGHEQGRVLLFLEQIILIPRTHYNQYSEIIHHLMLEVTDVMNIRKDTSGEKIEALINTVTSLRTDLTTLAIHVDAITQRVDHTEAEIATLAPILNSDSIQALQATIEVHKTQVNVQRENDMIYSNLYTRYFAKALVWHLNALYVATQAIHTGMIPQANTSTVSKVGSVLHFVGSCTPLVGPGLKIIGSVLKTIDTAMQKIGIERFAKIVDNSVQMAELSGKIARGLALADLKIENKDTGFFKSMCSTMMNLVKSVDTAELDFSKIDYSGIASISNIVADNAPDAQNKMLDFISYLKHSLGFTDQPRSPQEIAMAAAEKDASTIAKIITEIIFKGAVRNEEDLHLRIIAMVKVQCGLTTETIPVSKSAYELAVQVFKGLKLKDKGSRDEEFQNLLASSLDRHPLFHELRENDLFQKFTEAFHANPEAIKNCSRTLSNPFTTKRKLSKEICGNQKLFDWVISKVFNEMLLNMHAQQAPDAAAVPLVEEVPQGPVEEAPQGPVDVVTLGDEDLGYMTFSV